MNHIAASLIANLTCSSRFEGSLNVDLNEITTNLVPYRGLHFLVPSMSPLEHLTTMSKTSAPPPRGLSSMFSSIIRGDHQLITCEPSRDIYLACALLLRGNVQVSDVQHNMSKLRSKMRFIHWNSDGFKVGLCSMPSEGAPYSMLCLANNCCVRGTFKRLQDRFVKLYRARAHLHHYTEHMEKGEMDIALERSRNLIEKYTELSRLEAPERFPRMRPLF